MFSAILRLALFAFFCLCRFPSFALLALWGGGGVGGGLNDVLFRGQAFAAIIKSTTRGKEHATNETTAGGGRGRRHTHPPPAEPTYERAKGSGRLGHAYVHFGHGQLRDITMQASSPSNHHNASIITKQSSPCKHHHQATITMQTSSPSNHHHANINTKQPSPCKHHHQAIITMQASSPSNHHHEQGHYTYYRKPLPIKVFSQYLKTPNPEKTDTKPPRKVNPQGETPKPHSPAPQASTSKWLP